MPRQWLSASIEYPRGFSYTGRITQNKGIYGDEFSTGQTGVTITRQIYINNASNRLIWSGRSETFNKR